MMMTIIANVESILANMPVDWVRYEFCENRSDLRRIDHGTASYSLPVL